MSRELEDYRPNLERLLEHFPGREMISIKEACDYTGLDRRTLLGDESFPAKQVRRVYIVPLTGFARWISRI